MTIKPCITKTRGLLMAALTSLALMGGGMAQAQTPASPVAQDTLLVYLDQLTQWQRDAAAIEPSEVNARELVFRETLRQNATNVLQAGFTFLRSIASTEPTAEAANDPTSTRVKLIQRSAEIKATITTLQSRLARASTGQRGAIRDEIRLHQAQFELVQTILANLNAASAKSPNKLVYTIDSLARSIPELNPDDAKPVAPVTTTTTIETPSKRSATSIIGVTANVFAITRKQRELDEIILKTTQMKKDSMEVMKTLRSTLDQTAREPDAAAEANAEAIVAPVPLTIDQRVTAYKKAGATIIPLAESMRWMDSAKQTLIEWREVLEQQLKKLLSQLGVHLAILAAAIAIPLILSKLSKRGIERVSDPKRKRQLHTARRIVTGVAILFILLLNFISDFSSFATFAGFMTAGLAVALQSVLLSLVAHFLFYGRYGVRNGDRVHVNGVTGDIVQIGMVRFYLRELKDVEGVLSPTGKTVAFPNSILFQNVAFYKYAS